VYRYADFSVHPDQANLILAVREDHTSDLPSEVVNTIVLLDSRTQDEQVVVQANDFYSFPRFSPDGKKVLWLEVSFAPASTASRMNCC
jgi:Tol biopolymer transport system component